MADTNRVMASAAEYAICRDSASRSTRRDQRGTACRGPHGRQRSTNAPPHAQRSSRPCSSTRNARRQSWQVRRGANATGLVAASSASHSSALSCMSRAARLSSRTAPAALRRRLRGRRRGGRTDHQRWIPSSAPSSRSAACRKPLVKSRRLAEGALDVRRTLEHRVDEICLRDERLVVGRAALRQVEVDGHLGDLVTQRAWIDYGNG